MKIQNYFLFPTAVTSKVCFKYDATDIFTNTSRCSCWFCCWQGQEGLWRGCSGTYFTQGSDILLDHHIRLYNSDLCTAPQRLIMWYNKQRPENEKEMKTILIKSMHLSVFHTWSSLLHNIQDFWASSPPGLKASYLNCFMGVNYGKLFMYRILDCYLCSGYSDNVY